MNWHSLFVQRVGTSSCMARTKPVGESFCVAGRDWMGEFFFFGCEVESFRVTGGTQVGCFIGLRELE